METAMPIGTYLIQRLYECGVRHVFGVPGDFVLGFDKQLEDSPLVEFINTCDEQGAGFAADAYARLQGLGAVCITYCVGGLKVANTTAQAYAEKSPVVVISGAPGMNERIKNPPEAEQICHDRNILVLPDFIANAGGVICAAVEYRGSTQAIAMKTIKETIRHNTTLILENVARTGKLPRQVAVELAQQRIRTVMEKPNKQTLPGLSLKA